MSAVSVLLFALLLELTIGEPPARAHPVVWMGWCISRLEAMAPMAHRRLYGMVCVLIITSLFALLGLVIWKMSNLDGIVPSAVGILLAAYLLNSTFAVRSLGQAAEDIRVHLADGRLDAAKECLPALVSRDPSSLNEEQVASATVESVSENFVDGILSPLFYYVLLSPVGLGLAAALAFKVVSTFDSSWGYKNERFGELGWFCARTDDVLNFIPARLSVPLIMLSTLSFNRALLALRAAMREHTKTPSPNSGWPMAAYAGALGIRLEKPGAYVLCPLLRAPTPTDILRSVRLTYSSSASLFVGALVVLVLW